MSEPWKSEDASADAKAKCQWVWKQRDDLKMGSVGGVTLAWWGCYYGPSDRETFTLSVDFHALKVVKGVHTWDSVQEAVASLSDEEVAAAVEKGGFGEARIMRMGASHQERVSVIDAFDYSGTMNSNIKIVGAAVRHCNVLHVIFATDICGMIAAYAAEDAIDRLMAAPLSFMRAMLNELARWTRVYPRKQKVSFIRRNLSVDALGRITPFTDVDQHISPVTFSDVRSYILSHFRDEQWYNVPIFPGVSKLRVSDRPRQSSHLFCRLVNCRNAMFIANPKDEFIVSLPKATKQFAGTSERRLTSYTAATWGGLMSAIMATGSRKGGTRLVAIYDLVIPPPGDQMAVVADFQLE